MKVRKLFINAATAPKSGAYDEFPSMQSSGDRFSRRLTAANREFCLYRVITFVEDWI